MTDDTNETTIESSGPNPISEVKGALAGIDATDEDVEYVRVAVGWQANDTTTTTAAADGGGNDPDERVISLPVHPATEMTDAELRTYEIPSGDPERLGSNTHAHVLAVVFNSLVDDGDNGDLPVTASGLAALDGNPLTEPQTQSAVSSVFNKQNLLLRRSSGNAYAYHPTEELLKEAERLGNYRLGAVKGVQ